MHTVQTFFQLLIKSFKGWQKDDISVWSAALSYYSVFSLAPLLLLVVSIAGFFYGREAVEGEVSDQLSGLLGDTGALFIQDSLQQTAQTSTNFLSTIISIVMLILGATGVFGQLKQALNAIWGVKTKKSLGIKAVLRDRVLSLSMLVVIGFLLLISLIASTAISLIQTYFASVIPLPVPVIGGINFIASFSIVTVLFSLMFKILPDVQIKWKFVFVGGAMTALLFTLGKTALGMYLGSGSVTTPYGAAASLVIILLWVYYTSQIVFFGAEFTKFYTLHKSHYVEPSNYAVPTDETLSKDKKRLPASTNSDKNARSAQPEKSFFFRLLSALLLGFLYVFSRKHKDK